MLSHRAMHFPILSTFFSSQHDAQGTGATAE